MIHYNMLVVNDNVISKIDCICNYACIRNVCTSKELLSLYLNQKKNTIIRFQKGKKNEGKKYRFIYQINLVVITFNLILKKLENLKLNI